MKLLELKIRNIRGITRLDLTLNAETFLIVGNNGTGKSAVVDAIDFLLSGSIDRLTGRRGVSLHKHGKHVKAEPRDCYVEASIEVPGIADPVTLHRSIENPGALVASREALVKLGPFLAVAAQRQYILTRTNILNFISAAPRDRAALVQAVLNLGRIEELRQTLTTAFNGEKKRHDEARAARVAAEGAACNTLGLGAWGDQSALLAINRLREVLGGHPVESTQDVKKDVFPPGASVGEAASQGSEPKSDPLGNIRSVGKSVREETEAKLDAWDDALRADIAALNSSPENARAARQIELVELGIKLVDGRKCPLCDTDWDPDKLKAHLTEKAVRGRTAAPAWERVRHTADSMLRWLGNTEGTIAQIVEVGREGETGSDPAPLTEYSEKLGLLRTALADPLNLFLDYRAPEGKLSGQLGMLESRELLRSLYREKGHAAAANPAQKAWDTLTRADENLKALAGSRSRKANALKSVRRLEAVRSAFVDGRDRVLGDLYRSVGDRFVALYKELHAPEEQDFDAEMAPDGAGLSFDVDFQGMGKSAPFALHSDGHQDSMGLCLFLALAEKMQGSRLGFCLLDDVVMAIDAGHRLKVAKLLKSLGTDTQFLITTHDLVWARQLMMEGCVTRRTTTRFIGWSLTGGVVEGQITEFLGESDAALAKADVREAAASLRYGLESFFHCVADSIRAMPAYSLDGQYEMGEMYKACNRQLGELMKSANIAAESWQQTDVLKDLSEFKQRRTDALGESGTTQWAVNSNVHFNQWMNMTPGEFRPVLRNFEKVCNLFKCGACGSLLKLSLEGAIAKAVTCSCGKFSWNLAKR